MKVAVTLVSYTSIAVGGSVSGMRTWKYRVVTTVEGPNNRLMRLALARGFAPRAFALLETTGLAARLRFCW